MQLWFNYYNIQDRYSKRLLRYGLMIRNFPKQVLIITPMHIRDCGRPCLKMWLVISADHACKYGFVTVCSIIGAFTFAGRSQEHHRPAKVQKAVGPAVWTAPISNVTKYSKLQYSEVLSV